MVIGQHNLIYILCFPGIGSFWSNNLRCILCSLYDTGLVNTFLDIFRATHVEVYYVLAFLGVVWSAHVKIHFLSKQKRVSFGQHKSRFICYSRWHGTGVDNTTCVN